MGHLFRKYSGDIDQLLIWIILLVLQCVNRKFKIQTALIKQEDSVCRNLLDLLAQCGTVPHMLHKPIPSHIPLLLRVQFI